LSLIPPGLIQAGNGVPVALLPESTWRARLEMHDIRTIRDDAAAFDRALARRGLPARSAE
jgi:hypothetical protein